MQKRKYTQLKAFEGLILSMRQDGMTLQEIADELGLSLKQRKNWSYRKYRVKVEGVKHEK